MFDDAVTSKYTKRESVSAYGHFVKVKLVKLNELMSFCNM